jgi:hypothetical protein
MHQLVKCCCYVYIGWGQTDTGDQINCFGKSRCISKIEIRHYIQSIMSDIVTNGLEIVSINKVLIPRNNSISF